MSIELGKIGVWQWKNVLDDEFAAEVEQLGYGTIWIGGSPSGDLEAAERLLDATGKIAVATGIVNVWRDDAATVAESYHRIADKHPGRFLLGIGVGHPESTSEYTRPYAALTSYLDALDDAGVPVDGRALAALGPRVLELSAERTAGAHPYLTTARHTREARDVLGDGPLLAPEHKVVLEEDAERAREIARPIVGRYLGLRNYAQNLRRIGYTDADLADGGSDRLIDDLALHGSAATVAGGIAAHLDGGADHVCIQLLGDDLRAGYRALAAELL